MAYGLASFKACELTGLQAYGLGARSRDTRFHTTLHCNCVPRLQLLVCERQSEEELSAVVYLLYCMLDVGVPLFVIWCRRFIGDDTTLHYIGLGGMNPLTETMN